jgi:hypothetical protein
MDDAVERRCALGEHVGNVVTTQDSRCVNFAKI